jgi:signal transduction histidine kinase
MLANLSVLFMFFGVLGPLQVNDYNGYNNILNRILYQSSSLSYVYWYGLVILTFCCVVFGTYMMFLYFKSQNDIGYPRVSIEKSLKRSNLSVRVFSHGIKNQLLAQRVLIRQAKESLGNGNAVEFEKILDQMEEMTDNTTKRVTDLYKVFSANKIILEPVSLNTIVDKALDNLDKNKTQNTAIEKKKFSDVVILADKVCLSEAVENILDNAVDAVVSRGKNYPGEVTINCYKNGRYNVIEIADNGIGMDTVKMKKIFNPFYSNKNSSYSWGLGLSYTERIVRRHFGMIRLESKPDVGTRFYIFIPVYKGQ